MSFNEQTPAQYEQVVSQLLRTYLKDQGMGNLECFRGKKYRGRSGQEYEIDVAFEIRVGEIFLLILVECKRWVRAVGVEEVSSLAYRLRDIGAQKAILVATGGFQKGACQVARAEGIALLEATGAKCLRWWAGAVSQTCIQFPESLVIAIDTTAADHIVLFGKCQLTSNTICEPCELDDKESRGIYLIPPTEEGASRRRPNAPLVRLDS
jgi:Restriction endonuclease